MYVLKVGKLLHVPFRISYLIISRVTYHLTITVYTKVVYAYQMKIQLFCPIIGTQNEGNMYSYMNKLHILRITC